ncbi:hypothetical protein CYY_001183 [Polysphondylium violaceum]|uniref:HIT-type domain-containing protein n=1 Tax=Polysphondylium violaceum TaxID=133409 RepID=A0A8J4Q3L8_9MYCE|nr:hypothetical protein CYY_001183 [Polysphondylium violaceum]
MSNHNIIRSLLIVDCDDSRKKSDDKNSLSGPVDAPNVQKKKLITLIGEDDDPQDDHDKPVVVKDKEQQEEDNNNQFLKLSSVTYNNHNNKNNDNLDSTTPTVDSDDMKLSSENKEFDNNDINNSTSCGKKSDSSLCKVCKIQFSIYICPRCNISYCSSSCFKSHSENCTRGFYEEQVRDNLKAIDKVDPKDAIGFLKRIKEIYQVEDSKFEELVSNSLNIDDDDDDDDGDDGDDDQEDDSIDISKISSMTNEQLLALLSPSEIQEFYQSIKDGSISRLLDNWVPWWETEQQQQDNVKIREIKEKGQEEKENGLYIPSVHNEIPPLSKIFPNSPSESLYFHLLDILYCYCYLMRSYYGEWALDFFKDSFEQVDQDNIEQTLEGCEMILQLTTVLLPPTKSTIEQLSKQTSTPIILTSLLEKTHTAAHHLMNQGNTHFSFHIIQDMIEILSHKHSILAALSHMYRAFTHLSSSPSSSSPVSLSLTKTLSFVSKKLLFFLAWANERTESTIESLTLSVKTYYDQHKTAYKVSIKSDAIAS